MTKTPKTGSYSVIVVSPMMVSNRPFLTRREAIDAVADAIANLPNGHLADTTLKICRGPHELFAGTLVEFIRGGADDAIRRGNHLINY